MGVLALGGAAKTTGISGSCPWPLQAANWKDNASAPQPTSVAMTKMKCAGSFKNPNLPSFQKKNNNTGAFNSESVVHKSSDTPKRANFFSILCFQSNQLNAEKWPPLGTAASPGCTSPAATLQVGQKHNLKIPSPTDDSGKDKGKNMAIWHAQTGFASPRLGGLPCNSK